MDRRSFLAMLGTGIVAGRAHAGTGTSYKIGTVNFRALRPAVMQAWAGQSAGLARAESARLILQRLWDDALAILRY